MLMMKVVAWADDVIAVVEKPPYELIDVSRRKDDRAVLLRQGADHALAIRRALSRMRDGLLNGTIDLRATLASLTRFVWDDDNAPNDLRTFAMWADDEIDLIRGGYSGITIDDLRGDVIDQLAKLAIPDQPRGDR